MTKQDYLHRLDEALPRVRERIARAAERAGRDPRDVRVVAVTKAHPMAAVDAAVEAGLADLGENRVEGLEARFATLREEGRTLPGVRWHMIGHVQSRKAPRLPGLAGWIHSVDSVKLGERLARKAVDLGVEVKVLAQVNTSGEEAKGGFEAQEALEGIHQLVELPGLRVEGLMTMAPFVEDEGILRATFAGLRELRDRARGLDGFGAGELSMGMTNDFDVAVEEGSTMVRLGTILFGRRPE